MNQIERLELDLNTTRRNLTAVQDEHKAVIQLWEVITCMIQWRLRRKRYQKYDMVLYKCYSSC